MSYIDGLRSQMYDTERSIDNYKSKKITVDEKIVALKEARKEVAGIKKDISRQDATAEYIFGYLDNWKGSNYDEYEEQVHSGLKEEYKQYYNKVDDVLDSINDEITRLRNESYDLDNSLKWLQSKINILFNEIRNAMN